MVTFIFDSEKGTEKLELQDLAYCVDLTNLRLNYIY